MLEQTISANDFESAIAPMNGNDWASVGLVRFVDAGVRANVELCLYGSMIAAADWTGENENEVMGIAPSSRALLPNDSTSSGRFGIRSRDEQGNSVDPRPRNIAVRYWVRM